MCGGTVAQRALRRLYDALNVTLAEVLEGEGGGGGGPVGSAVRAAVHTALRDYAMDTLNHMAGQVCV